MPSMDWSAMDDAIAEMRVIGYDGWVAKQAYIEGRISHAQFEATLDRQLGLTEAGGR